MLCIGRFSPTTFVLLQKMSINRDVIIDIREISRLSIRGLDFIFSWPIKFFQVAIFIIFAKFTLCTTCYMASRSRIASRNVGTRKSILYIPSFIFYSNDLVYRNKLSCISWYTILFVFITWQLSKIKVQRLLKSYLEYLFCSIADLCSFLWLRYFLKTRQRTLGVLNFCNRMASCLMVTSCKLNIDLNTMYRQNIILTIKKPHTPLSVKFFYSCICPNNT